VNAQTDIDELISKYFSGETSPEEAMRLEDWKNLSEENRLYFLQCQKLLSPPVRPVSISDAWNKVSSKVNAGGKVVSIRPLSYFLRIAASIVLLAGLGIAAMYWFNKDNAEQVLYVANEASKQVVLSDGSDVIISPNSSLTADAGFGKKERLLHLKGSASFSVVHDEKVPFVVEAGGVFIKDIGTRFFIRTSADTDTVHVRVDEGVVLLFDDKGANVEIKAGGNALYVKSTKQIVQEPAKAAPVKIDLANSTLAEVVVQLNKAYGVTIEIANPALNNCTITTRFSNEKLETILSVIAETLGLTYEKTDKGYILKGEQCKP